MPLCQVNQGMFYLNSYRKKYIEECKSMYNRKNIYRNKNMCNRKIYAGIKPWYQVYIHNCSKLYQSLVKVNSSNSTYKLVNFFVLFKYQVLFHDMFLVRVESGYSLNLESSLIGEQVLTQSSSWEGHSRFYESIITAQSSLILRKFCSCSHKEVFNRNILVTLQAWNW